MALVRLKGLNRVKARLSSGKAVEYWYAWKGGPRLEGKPGSPEFVASYNRAVADRRAPDANTLSGLVAQYRASPEFVRIAASTKAEWGRWLDRITDTRGDLSIGDLTLAMLNDRRVRSELLDWRDQWADRPRTADYGIQVLSRVLAFGVDRGKLATNAAAGIAQLYRNDRADKIWEPKDEEAYVAAAPSPEVAFIVPLATATGLRREDLARLLEDQVGDIAIVMATGKSRGLKSVVIPLLPSTRTLLDRIRAQKDARYAELRATAARKGRPPPPRALTVLTNTRGRPWSPDGLEHQVVDTKAKANIDKHLHDARGTFATRLRSAGLSGSEIADILGWKEDRVARLLATYVDRERIVRGIAARVQENESGAKIPK